MAFVVEIALAVARKDTSAVQVKNKQDLYQAVTNRETFTSILEQGLEILLANLHFTLIYCILLFPLNVLWIYGKNDNGVVSMSGTCGICG